MIHYKYLIIIACFYLLPVSHLAEAADYKEPTTGIEFVKINGGQFVMGDILRKEADSSPPHRVTINDFWLSKHEVTFQQYDLFCDAVGRAKPNDEGWGRGNRPVINVSWQDASAFTQWLSEKSGRNVRLPSEAQWEYAARGGRTTAYWWGSKIETNMANCSGCGSKWDNQMTAPTGSFRANPMGLFDTAGNVSEWVYDKAHENYENAPSDDMPWLENGLEMRVVRGGSYTSMAPNITVFFRDWYPETLSLKNNGFRIAILD